MYFSYMAPPARIFRLLTAFLCLTLVNACKIEISVPEGGHVVSESYECRAGTVCTIDVNDTEFDQTFMAIPDSDPIVFAGWKRDKGYFCGGKLTNCRLHTLDFDDYPALLPYLDADDEVFFLSPVFEEISDDRASGATPFSIRSDRVLTGSLGAEQVSYDYSYWTEVDDSDYFVFVAPSDGHLVIELSDISVDLDLYLESALDILAASLEYGSTPEQITLDIAAGETYYINIFAIDNSYSEYNLTVSFDAYRHFDSLVGKGGAYRISSKESVGYCESGEILVSAPEAGEFIVNDEGAYTESWSGNKLDDNFLVYRQYANEIDHGTSVKREVHKQYHGDGNLYLVRERLVSGQFTPSGITGESIERELEFDSDGTRLDDCMFYRVFSGVKID